MTNESYPVSSRCRICLHPQRDEIDHALREGMGGKAVGEMFGFSKSIASNHRIAHLMLPSSVPQRCSVCVHPERAAIDRELMSDLPIFIVRQHFAAFGFSLDTLKGHKRRHIMPLLHRAGSSLQSALSLTVATPGFDPIRDLTAALAAAESLNRFAVDSVNRARGTLRFAEQEQRRTEAQMHGLRIALAQAGSESRKVAREITSHQQTD